MKINLFSKNLTSIITAVLTSWFIEIIWYYNYNPGLYVLSNLVILGLAVPLIFKILIYYSRKLGKQIFDKQVQIIYIAVLLVLIFSSLAYLIYIIYGREQGPWTMRNGFSWGSQRSNDWVFDLPIGILGLIVIYSLWFLVNINFSDKRYSLIQYTCLIIYLIIMILLYFASKVPINFSLYQG